MNLIRKKGFSLVELIVVVAIFGMLFVIVSNTFFNSMKAAIKAEALKEVRQNGDVAMARMVYDLKSARSACDAGPSNSKIIYTDSQGNQLYYQWIVDSLTGSETTRLQRVDQDGTIDWITDRNSVSLVSSDFNCTNYSTDGSVAIDFTLQYVPFGIIANITNNSLRSEEKIEMTFHTTVVPRNTN